MPFARRLVLASFALLAATATPALAKLDGPQWRDAESKFRTLFAQSGQGPEKEQIVKTVLDDGEPRAFALVADGIVLEAGYCGRIQEILSEKLTQLQGFLGKKDDDWRPGEENQMLTLMGEVSSLERAKADEDKVLKALVLGAASGTEALRKAVVVKAKGHADWAVRASGMRVAAGAPDEVASRAMLQTLDAEKDPRVKMAALDALSTAPGANWHPFVVGRIEDADWGVVTLAARVAGAREIGRAIPVLIQALVKASPRVAEEITAALFRLTRQKIEPYADVWAKWWADHRSEYGEDGRPIKPVQDQPRPEDIEFYGLKVKSDRVLFVIDTSGSMQYEIKNPNEGGKVVTGDEKPKEPKFSGPKIEVAKQQLKRAIEKLPKAAIFNVIAFNHAVRQWQPKMMQATPDNKEAAYAWFRNEPAKGSTYIDGALRMAFNLAGTQALDKHYSVATVDTIILLSDGAPTDNGMPTSKDMDPAEVLGHVREWNPDKRVIIHCVGIDNIVKGIDFLKKLAAENGGTYVDG